ncbi:hypothetical protein A9Q84_00560 [Halobacteriovorax marinus]|uniref:Uncharacterized protein n=1 Tax=Halobacteriovorax marinus TaxID=97084 RepID=A0A1Y5FH85_9BACT|nr:hypothetical protein A9Q84_00560 [Halobacteriovorax marinus]
MKKIFNIKVSNKNPERQADSIKHEVKKYISRERRKKTSENVDFWDFDCRIGLNAEEASTVEISDINSNITKFVEENIESFYLEILAKPGYKPAKQKEKK